MKRETSPVALLLPPDIPAQLPDELVVQCLDAGGCHTLSLAAALSHLGSRPAVLVLAQEQVSFHAPRLPRARRGLQQQALAFAVEPHLGQALESVHLAAGQPLADGRWLVAAIDRALLAGWCSQLAAAGLVIRAIHVDADLLPEQGMRGVHLPGRCLLADDQGLRMAFAPAQWPQVQAGLVEPVRWLGSPAREPALEPADDALPPALTEPLLPLLVAGDADRVDLAQGPFALRSPGGGLRWRALGYALAAALLLQLGSVLVQGALYGKQARMYEQANLALFESVFGEQRVVDLRQQFDSLRAGQMASNDVIALLQRIDGQLSLPVQTLQYHSAQGQLLLTPEAGFDGNAQEIAAQLEQAGLRAGVSASGWPLQVEAAQ